MGSKRSRSISPSEPATKKVKIAPAAELTESSTSTTTQPASAAPISGSNESPATPPRGEARARARDTTVTVRSPPSILRRPRNDTTGQASSPPSATQSSSKSVRFDLGNNTSRSDCRCVSCASAFPADAVNVLSCGHYVCAWCALDIMTGLGDETVLEECSGCRHLQGTTTEDVGEEEDEGQDQEPEAAEADKEEDEEVEAEGEYDE